MTGSWGGHPALWSEPQAKHFKCPIPRCPTPRRVDYYTPQCRTHDYTMDEVPPPLWVQCATCGAPDQIATDPCRYCGSTVRG